MLVECNYCGAPLDVREGARLVKCRYCGSVSERARQKTVAQVTPPDFRPPPRWTPPAHVPADSGQELAYKSNRAGLIVGLLVLFGGLLIPLVLIGTKALGAAGVGAAGGAELARVSLGQTSKALASSLSGRDSGTSVYVPLNSDRFEFVTFSYNEKHPEHPTSFYFSGKKAAQLDARLRAALTQKLESDLDENGSWRWEHVWLNTDPKTGSVGGNVDTELSAGEPNPYWKRQLVALWQIVVAAAFNQATGPTQAEARELLGTGYPFLDLAKLSSATPVETAPQAVSKLFPGSVFSARSGLSAHIAVNHPLFRVAELEWKNEKGATLYHAGFRSKAGPGGYEGRHDQVATCLTPVFGAPTVNETDYLKKKKDYYFDLKAIRIYVSSTWLYFYANGPLDPREWSRLVTALDACRK